jgi:hypothetical protein
VIVPIAAIAGVTTGKEKIILLLCCMTKQRKAAMMNLKINYRKIFFNKQTVVGNSH